MSVSLLGRFGFGVFGARRRAGGQNTVTLPAYLLQGGALPTVAEGFEDATQWAQQAGSPTIENNTTAKQFGPMGTQSVKLIATAGSGAVTMRKTGLNLDLSAGIYLPFYVFNHIASSKAFSLTLYQAGAFTKRLTINLTAARTSKWNVLWVLKSAMSAFGGGTFADPITAIDLSFTSTGIGQALSFDCLCFGVTPVPAVSVQLHDGWPAHYAFGYPQMLSRGLRGVIVCHESIIDTSTNLTYAQYNEIEAAGWEGIQHSNTHTAWSGMADQATMQADMAAARSALIAGGVASGPLSAYACYPNGESGWSTIVEDALAAEGYVMATTAGEDYTFFPYPNFLQMGQQLTGPVSGATIEGQLATMATNGGLKRMVVHDIQAASGDLTEAEFTGVLDEIVALEIPALTESEIYQLATGNSVTVPVPW